MLVDNELDKGVLIKPKNIS